MDKTEENLNMAPNFFSQESENAPADTILIHKPSKEVFMSMLHPAASLYENVTEEKSIAQCFRNLTAILISKGIKVKTVRECLKLNRPALEELAFNSLKYEPSDSSKNDLDNENFKYYLSDAYKREVISKLWVGQLVDLILTQPTYKIKYIHQNTFVEPETISFKPLGNLLFCRDQQITTKKGVVIGRAISLQRAIEHKVMEQVYRNLNANVIGHAPEGCFLEGGDFFVAKPDLAMCGVGLRTNMGAMNYLMEKDLLGTERFAIVYDETDLDQQRMHLDTYFNIVSEKYVVVLDFEKTGAEVNKKINRKVYLFNTGKDITPIESGNSKVINKVGNYKLEKIFNDFYTYLEYEGYKMIKISNQQQKDYMINFLNIGNNTILTVNPDLKNVIKETGVDVIYVEFQAVMKMFGALHCATQVSRKPFIKVE